MKHSSRPSLATLNIGFARDGVTSDFDTRTEYRVGKWGVAWSRDGYSSRGQGGEKLHLAAVTVITAVHIGYDWQTYCASSYRASTWLTREQNADRRARFVSEHGSYNHHCSQPKVGDVLAVNPACRYNNVRGTGAFTSDQADTNAINCANCASVAFGEDKATIAAEVRAAEAAAKAERKAAKPLPARCFVCGDVRPQTKATLAGEQLPCSYCKDLLETIAQVELGKHYLSGYRSAAELASVQEDAYVRLERRASRNG